MFLFFSVFFSDLNFQKVAGASKSHATLLVRSESFVWRSAMRTAECAETVAKQRYTNHGGV